MKKKEKETKTKEQEYLDGWKRALADYENLQRDMSSRLDDAKNRMKSDFAHDLLPVMDNFAQAVNHAPKLEDTHKPWLDGVLYIQKQFEDVLKGLGLEKIEVTEFDPNLHEAVGEGEELKEVQSGWKIGERVIRPAQVITKKQ